MFPKMMMCPSKDDRNSKTTQSVNKGSEVERRFVSLNEVAAAIALVAEKFASSQTTVRDAMEQAQILDHWLDAEERRTLIELLTTPRIRCPRCSKCVSVNGRKASGPHCLPCAITLRRETENEMEA